MKAWYEIPSDGRDEEQSKACRIAYCQSLLATPYGRQFYADLRRRVRELDELVAADKDCAFAVVLFHDFMRETRRLCGPVDDMAVIEAEQTIANRQQAEEPKQTEPKMYA